MEICSFCGRPIFPKGKFPFVSSQGIQHEVTDCRCTEDGLLSRMNNPV